MKNRPAERSIAHQCYGHLGGRLSTLLMERMLELGWLELKEGAKTVYDITEKGYRGLGEWGIDVAQLVKKE